MDFDVIAILFVIVLGWGLLVWWSLKKPDFSRIIVAGNVVIWLSYTIYLMSVLFNPELSRGGGGFAAVMMTMIISPIHVAVTRIVTYLSFKTSRDIGLVKAVLFSMAPTLIIVFFYFIWIFLDF